MHNIYIYIYSIYIYNPQKINIYALKIDGWKMKSSFFKSVIFRFYLFVLEGEMVVVVLSIWLGMGHPRKSKDRPNGLPIGRIGNPCSMDHPKDHSTCLVHRTSREFVTFGCFFFPLSSDNVELTYALGVGAGWLPMNFTRYVQSELSVTPARSIDIH